MTRAILAVVLVAAVAAVAAVVVFAGKWLALVLALLAAWTAFVYATDRLKEVRLRRAFEREHGVAGRRLVIVYSRSPHWQEHIERHWLSRYGDRAVVLDWSDRSRWPRTGAPVAVEAFRRWGGAREFNPLVIAVPRHGSVRTVRFWRAFRDLKHGKDRTLRAAEAELERLAAEVSRP